MMFGHERDAQWQSSSRRPRMGFVGFETPMPRRKSRRVLHVKLILKNRRQVWSAD